MKFIFMSGNKEIVIYLNDKVLKRTLGKSDLTELVRKIGNRYVVNPMLEKEIRKSIKILFKQEKKEKEKEKEKDNDLLFKFYQGLFIKPIHDQVDLGNKSI